MRKEEGMKGDMLGRIYGELKGKQGDRYTTLYTCMRFSTSNLRKKRKITYLNSWDSIFRIEPLILAQII